MTVTTIQDARPFTRVPSIDVLRGLAALMIVFFHYFALYPLPHAGVNGRVTMVVLGFFALGVPIFYALSGISLCLGFFEQRGESRFARRFYVRRLLRIAPLFYTAFLIWILIFGKSLPKLGLMLTTLTFTSNLIVGHETTVVAAGWSVGVEMIFYLLFPLIVRYVTSLRRSIAFWVLATVVAGVSFYALDRLFPQTGYNTKSFLPHLVYFATGILAYFLFCRGSARSTLAAAGIAGALLSVAVITAWLVGRTYLHDPGNFGVQLFAHLAWSIPLLALLGFACFTGASRLWARPFTAVGEWSFSIYLLHPILIVHYVAGYLRSHPQSALGETARFWAWLGLTLGILLVVSWATYTVIERPGMRLGRRWAKALTARPITDHRNDAGPASPAVG